MENKKATEKMVEFAKAIAEELDLDFRSDDFNDTKDFIRLNKKDFYYKKYNKENS